MSPSGRDIFKGESSQALEDTTEWMNQQRAPGVRLVAFERWLFALLGTQLVWPADSYARERMIGQCRAFVVEAVGDLERHGFLFNDRQLASMLREKIDQIARLQKLGKVENLYPYFRACWSGWVRSEADRLRERAMCAGSHVNQVTQRLLVLGKGRAEQPIVGVVAESLREQAAAARRKARQEAAEDACQPNFLFTPPESGTKKRR